MILMFFQCILLVLVFKFVLDRWKKHIFFKIHRQLGCETIYLPVIGNALRFLVDSEGIMTRLQKGAELSYKNKHGAISYWIGNNFLVEISDPKQACVVLRNALDKNFIHDTAKHLIGNGSVFAPTHEWYRRRKTLDQIFIPRNVNKFVGIFDKQVKIVLDQVDIKNTEKINMSCWDYICPYSFNTICDSVLGINLSMQNQGEFSVMNAFFEYLKIQMLRLFQPWLQFSLFNVLPESKRREQLKIMIHDYINDIIHKKKMLMEKRDTKYEYVTGEVWKNDIRIFLELMIETSKNNDVGYTDEELLEEVLVLMMAGSDTTTTAIAFTMVMLSQHPDVQERVYQEILEVFGESDRPIQLSDLQKLKYLEAVLKETMRLFPPVPAITRHCSNDIELPSGLILPKGTTVIINIRGIHHNPNYWGAEASDFNPERFLSGRIPVTSAFMPFSIGARNCIGNHFAMLSMKTVVSKFVRRYRFLPATSYKYDKHNPLRISFQITAKHVNNFELQIQPRR